MLNVKWVLERQLIRPININMIFILFTGSLLIKHCSITMGNQLQMKTFRQKLELSHLFLSAQNLVFSVNFLN